MYCCACCGVCSPYKHLIRTSDRQVRYNPRVGVKESVFRSARKRPSSPTRASTNKRDTRYIFVASAHLRKGNIDMLPSSCPGRISQSPPRRSAKPVIWRGCIHIVPLSSDFFCYRLISYPSLIIITAGLVDIHSTNRRRCDFGIKMTLAGREPQASSKSIFQWPMISESSQY